MVRKKIKRIVPNFPDIKVALRAQPRTVAHEIAKRLAPELTRLARESYDSGRTAYNQPRRRGSKGNALDLVDSGDTRRDMQFEAVGTVTRCVLGTPYARYLIGRYAILPNGGASIPVHWARSFRAISADVVQRMIARRAA